MKTIMVACLIGTILALDCWRQDTDSQQCDQFTISDASCDFSAGQYKNHWTCCADSFYTDRTGYTTRKCSGMTLQGEYRTLQKSKSAKKKKLPQKYPDPRRAVPIAYLWKSPTTSEYEFGIMRKTIGSASPKSKGLYSDYITDGVYYPALLSIIGDPLMKHFQNQIVKGKVSSSGRIDWRYYYRQYFWTKPFDESTCQQFSDDEGILTVKNIQELAVIFFMDLIFLNKDRFTFNEELHASVFNMGNMMLNQDDAIYTWFPIDNGGGIQHYFRYLYREKSKFFAKQLNWIEDLITKDDKLYETAQKFVEWNKSYFNKEKGRFVCRFLPKWASDDVLTDIVYNTWYFYGKTIGERIEWVLVNGGTSSKGVYVPDWNDREKDDMFDGEGNFLEAYLKPVFEILKQMPKTNKEIKKPEISGKLSIGLMNKKKLKEFAEDLVKKEEEYLPYTYFTAPYDGQIYVDYMVIFMFVIIVLGLCLCFGVATSFCGFVGFIIGRYQNELKHKSSQNIETI